MMCTLQPYFLCQPLCFKRSVFQKTSRISEIHQKLPELENWGGWGFDFQALNRSSKTFQLQTMNKSPVSKPESYIDSVMVVENLQPGSFMFSEFRELNWFEHLEISQPARPALKAPHFCVDACGPGLEGSWEAQPGGESTTTMAL